MVNGQMIVRIIQYLDPGFDVMATMPIRWNLQGPAPVSHTVVRTDRALMMLAQNVVEYGLITAGNKGAALFTSRFAELGIVSGQILAPQVAIGFGPIGDTGGGQFLHQSACCCWTTLQNAIRPAIC